MERREEDELDRTDAVIRTLRADDLDRLVRMDHAWVGRSRREWLHAKLDRALRESSVAISLGAESDGILVGALMGAVHFGEYGLAEPVAILDTILVDRAFTGRGYAQAMMEQLLRNLHGLRIERLRTEVDWDDHDLVGFLARQGFMPVPRLVLERAI